MRVGLQIIRFDWDGDINSRLRDIATTVDEAGFYSLWVMDHFFQMGGIFGEPDTPMLEGYATISYLAALTQKVKIGTLVTGNFYRPPGLLAKMVTTLDVLSGGRAYLGIGAGWYEQEALGLGLPFPSMKERFERLEETLQIVHHMWRGDTTPFEGEFHHLLNPINQPRPISQPHPPILIGGEGERKTMKLIAQYGDACNFYFGATVNSWGEWHTQRFENRRAHLTHKLTVLRQHCNTQEREYDDIEKTVLGTIQLNRDGMTASALVDLCRELADIGFDHVIFNMPDTHQISPLEVFGATIIPQVSTL
ncbi:MAG: LLM class F420-dependent oxidoreductase [Chloroflexota bacterium]